MADKNGLPKASGIKTSRIRSFFSRAKRGKARKNNALISANAKESGEKCTEKLQEESRQPNIDKIMKSACAGIGKENTAHETENLTVKKTSEQSGIIKKCASSDCEEETNETAGWKCAYDLPSDEERRQRWIEKVKAARVRGEKTDPFQFFEVTTEPCHLLKVRVLRGRNISKGKLGDMIDTPDPYVVVHVRIAPDGRKATHHVDNDPNPEWDEELTYLLPPDKGVQIIAEISLMDSNYSVDECYGSLQFDLSAVKLEQKVCKTFKFNETSEVDIEFCKEVRFESDLRSSLALCDEEKSFRSIRKKFIYNAMREFMEKRNAIGPRVLRETPIIAVLGSGGGFRAMTGYAGAMKALHDSGVLDCVTYVSGLSGSSWYLATLFAHEKFPQEGTDAANKEIRKNIESSPFWLLRPECLLRYSHRLRAKMKTGQPVTFVDIFGMLIGQTLLGPEKMNTAKLSDFHEKIKGGKAPMPIVTCLHVRPKTSAMTFHDWVEFSPYEIGMAKYGTFMNTRYFGSKFYMGVMAKQHEESPLHFLMGVWGSAFSILFNRLTDKKENGKNESKADNIRQEMEEELSRSMKHGGNEEDSESELDSDSEDDKFEDAMEKPAIPEPSKERRHTWIGATTITPQPVINRATEKRPSMFASLWNWGTGGGGDSLEETEDETPTRSSGKSGGFINSIVGSVFGRNFMESREYRAGKILNYMRGVSLSNTYPLSPFTPEASTIAEDGEFQLIHEPIEVRRKKVHLVDAGLTFNSPYPAVLRPQRSVDLILSFDFSARPGEDVEPFKEILLAEKWARMHNLPFPKIDRSVYKKGDMKECYVFKDDTDETAPIIVHFVLCNIQFRKFSKPGVSRSVFDRKGDFNVFDNPKNPYSTFNFQYSNEAFDRLHDLMEFNTLLHIDTIVEQIIACIKLRRHSKFRGSINLNDIRNSIHMSAKCKKILEGKLLSAGGEDGRIFLD